MWLRGREKGKNKRKHTHTHTHKTPKNRNIRLLLRSYSFGKKITIICTIDKILKTVRETPKYI
jgi:hypothetical protein